MIPEIFIEQWRQYAPWRTLAQIEQDLVISRALVDLYRDPYIKEALVFRGGTALNKLFIKPPARYSEDIDFVQKRAEPIGKTIDTLRKLLQPWLKDPVWKITKRSAKLVYKYETINKLPAKLKIEINTTEHFQVLPLQKEFFTVESDWFIGSSEIVTYSIDELIATKLRALYQRRKGRDLFDLWYVAKFHLINIEQVIDIFAKYCLHDGIFISREEFIKNLEQKKNYADFNTDMSVLLHSELSWDFEEAYKLVMNNIIRKI
jgi:predicted nucleotidyltransferase component of viral defense system